MGAGKGLVGWKSVAGIEFGILDRVSDWERAAKTEQLRLVIYEKSYSKMMIVLLNAK